ncbi:MAG TPA: glycosyltransferase N-terminal domain-containing protein, partial [Gemmatimonadales bacterium]|nr:glycosyltransferase N-terminal domain-containing protein [Gemmatimonadales bacterium]
MTSFLYRALANLAVPLVPIALRDPRQRQAHAARLGAPARLATWAAAHRDPTRPLVWCHAPSVGEGQQARSVLRALRALRPDLQVAYTHFSPSAERFAQSVGADVTDYLPYDCVADTSAVLAALRPDLLVFAKLDVWPELVAQAVSRQVPCALVAGTVLPDSGRL